MDVPWMVMKVVSIAAGTRRGGGLERLGSMYVCMLCMYRTRPGCVESNNSL